MRLLPILLLSALPAAVLPAAVLPTAALAAPSQDWSAAIARDGLAATGAAITALPAPSPEDLFALGATQFLTGIEQALHLRWQVGATGEMAPLPVLRLALPPNPAPQPYRASLVTEVFTGLATRMVAADATLARIPPDADLGLTIRLEDIWLDIDGSGTRGPGEDLLPLAGAALANPWDEPAPLQALSVRFDRADAHWLGAYANLLAGIGCMVQAFDPTEPTARVLAAAADKRARLASPNPSTLDQFDEGGWIDKATIALLALRQQPDAALTRQTAAHLAKMTTMNRLFWQAVALESDNDAEWIPNPRQSAALGFTLPEGTDLAWQGILAELDQMLQGKLLVPHVALPPEAGINIAAWLENPNPLDLLGWAQGMDALPYAQKGPVISGQSWAAFEQIMQGRGLMFALLLN